jgi:hypothetical protein
MGSGWYDVTLDHRSVGYWKFSINW